MNFKSSFIFT